MQRRLAISVALVLASAGCAPRAGRVCHGTQTECTDRSSALICVDGRFERSACEGKLGCREAPTGSVCDTSAASAGAACAEEGGFACAADGKSTLRCTKGKMAPAFGCRGPKGCLILGSSLSCDSSLAREGEPCNNPDTFACSDAKRDVLVCGTTHAWSVHRHCRGPAGCNSDADAPSCDESIALTNDPCGVPGHLACSVDGKTELVCQDGRFSAARACKKACQILAPAGGIRCD